MLYDVKDVNDVVVGCMENKKIEQFKRSLEFIGSRDRNADIGSYIEELEQGRLCIEEEIRSMNIVLREWYDEGDDEAIDYIMEEQKKLGGTLK